MPSAEPECPTCHYPRTQDLDGIPVPQPTVPYVRGEPCPMFGKGRCTNNGIPPAVPQSSA